jgi:dTMP kinase
MEQRPLKAGIFLTFEGGDGSGKTTLINSIADHLASLGYQVAKTREPGGTGLGEEIRRMLLHHKEPVSPYAELALFLASRAQHVFEFIRPALREGKIVLCDRFNDSSIAYQGVARGLGRKQVKAFAEFVSQGLYPHLTIYLDIDPEIGLQRASRARTQDRIEAETLAFHQKIRAAYINTHKKDPYRFRLIDASQSPEEVFEQAMKWIDPLISKHV